MTITDLFIWACKHDCENYILVDKEIIEKDIIFRESINERGSMATVI